MFCAILILCFFELDLVSVYYLLFVKILWFWNIFLAQFTKIKVGLSNHQFVYLCVFLTNNF
jgi:hypothetical protein